MNQMASAVRIAGIDCAVNLTKGVEQLGQTNVFRVNEQKGDPYTDPSKILESFLDRNPGLHVGSLEYVPAVLQQRPHILIAIKNP